MHRHPPAGLSSSKSVRSDLQPLGGGVALALRVAQSPFLVSSCFSAVALAASLNPTTSRLSLNLGRLKRPTALLL